ncbi:hypothetical protein [Paenibacillus sp. 1P03SA]|uniref:DUF5983 family protein n=1 Tax=Paenibacillus sp. 1P03SA TaxID=3132294 RepID=UPI0039A3991E
MTTKRMSAGPDGEVLQLERPVSQANLEVTAVDTQELPIYKLLDVSLFHLSRETSYQLLELCRRVQKPFSLMVYGAGDMSFVISVPDDPALLKTLPSDLKAVLTYANKKGCAWILLDAIADIFKDLQSYDWSVS